MRKSHPRLIAIESSFVVAIIGSFSVLGVAGFLFGFQLSQWTEWQGVVAGVMATIAAVVGALFGLRLTLDSDR